MTRAIMLNDDDDGKGSVGTRFSEVWWCFFIVKDSILFYFYEKGYTNDDFFFKSKHYFLLIFGKEWIMTKIIICFTL